MKKIFRNPGSAGFILIAILFFLLIPVSIIAQEIIIGNTQQISIPPGPDYALLTNISELSNKRIQKKDKSAAPGETLFLDIRIINTGREMILGINAELSCTDNRIGKFIFLEKRTAFIGDLAAGTSTTLTSKGTSGEELLQRDGLDNAFRFSLEKRCSTEPIVFTITFKDSLDREWTQSLTIPVDPLESGENVTIGSLSFFVSTLLIEKGTQFEAGVGWEYSTRFSGEFKFRRQKSAETTSWESVIDSNIAVAEDGYVFVLLPIRYDIIRNPNFRTWLGFGGFYQQETSTRKGYFNEPDLIPIGHNPLNTIKNDLTYKIMGPTLDIGFTFRGSDWFKASLSGGLDPIFYIIYDQTVSYYPMVIPDVLQINETFFGSPRLFGTLSGIISLPNLGSLAKGSSFSPSDWKLWFSFYYDYFRWKHKVPMIERVDSIVPPLVRLYHYTRERTQIDHIFKIEGALLIPIAGIYLQLGGGLNFNRTYYDSDKISDGQSYFINITGKTLKF